MAFPPELLLFHPMLSVDASTSGVTPGPLRALPWERAFSEMAALEAGAIANPDEGRQVGHYWLRSPSLAPDLGKAEAIGAARDAVQAFARGVRSGEIVTDDGSAFTDFLLVGIGGSALGPQLVDAALGRGGLTAHFFDNTDPDGIADTLRRIGDRLHTTLCLVVSKSGGTAETRNGMILARRAYEARGIDFASRAVAITQDGSALHREATAWRARFPMWDWVGGRTSVCSAVGLLPAELAGVDTTALLDGAAAMDEWTRTPSVDDNPAALLAGAWFVLGHGRGDRAMVVLPYSDRLSLLSRYLQQLVMESIGKELDLAGRPVSSGIVVYGNKGSTDQHAFVQQLRDGRDDAFVHFLQVLDVGGGAKAGSADVEPGIDAGDYLQGFLLGTRRALADKRRPSLTITVPSVTAASVGALIALFERAVGLYASLIGVNAYHQPGVEAGKKAAGEVLQVSLRLRAALRQGPGDIASLAARIAADPVEVFHVAERLVATGRIVREGLPPRAVYRA
jgi:glucose-6-phosphate isomerase